MNSDLYSRAHQVQTSEEATALLAECVADLRTMSGPIVPLSNEEADRIARKNLVMAARAHGPAALRRAEALFKCVCPVGAPSKDPQDFFYPDLVPTLRDLENSVRLIQNGIENMPRTRDTIGYCLDARQFMGDIREALIRAIDAASKIDKPGGPLHAGELYISGKYEYYQVLDALCAWGLDRVKERIKGAK